MARVSLLLLALFLPASAEDFLSWAQLPDMPEPLGVAGPFVGVSNGALVVAGGAHFETSPLQGGVKLWIDRSYAFEPGSGNWREASPLPRPLAYGGAVSTANGMIWAGGSDSQQHYRDVYRVVFENGQLSYDPLPPLPRPAANLAATVLGDTVYLLGGQEAPNSTEALKTFWALDLSAPDPQWQELEPWPGPGRILASAASQDGAVYLFGGAELLPAGGAATRRFLSDGYRYRPGEGWAEVAGPPNPVVAAPTVAWGPTHVLVVGGDDGSSFFRNDELGDSHPGFRREVLAYHTVTDTWTNLGATPFGHVTTHALEWQGNLVIPSGEDRPGHRSPSVWTGTPKLTEPRFATADYIALGLYLASLVLMGIYFSRKNQSTDDFFLAGRKIPWWAAGLSIYGTQLSSISFMAVPAKVYSTDWVYLLVQASIVMIAVPVVFVYLPFFRQTNMTSAYEYLESRFNLPTRLFASTAFILYQLGRMSIVLFLPAIALSTVTGIGVYTCIIVMGALATLYTVMGGIEAVIWTDVIQVFVLLGGAILSLIIILTQVDGGLSGLIATGSAAGKFHTFNWNWDYTTTAVWVVLIGNLFNNLVPYTSDQAVIQRYLTTKDEKSAARAIWTNALMIPFSTLVLFLVGTGLWAFYRQRPELLSPSLPADSIFPLFISQELPTGLAGLVIAGVFAASMSTLDSSLNSVSTAMVTDFYSRFRRAASDAARLRLARILTAILGVAATGISITLATFNIGSLWDTFQGMMGLFGGSMAGLFALGILTTRANGTGAMVGAISAVFILAWVQTYTPTHFFLYGMVGVLSCFVIGWTSSLFFGRPHRNLTGLTVFTRRP